MTYYSGGIGSPYRPKGTQPQGKVRAGWWFWYPLIFGLFFTIGGIAFLVGAAGVPEAGAGLGITGVTFLVIGIGSLLVAWWAWRDIHSDDSASSVPGQPSSETEASIRVTGIPGQATVKSVKYMSGSTSGDTTMVELGLDVSTVKGGNVAVTTQTRVPLSLTQQVGAGATVPVVVSSTDPNKIVVEWAGLTPAH